MVFHIRNITFWVQPPKNIPVIVTIGDSRDYIGVLLCLYYVSITGWGGPPKKYPLSGPYIPNCGYKEGPGS